MKHRWSNEGPWGSSEESTKEALLYGAAYDGGTTKSILPRLPTLSLDEVTAQMYLGNLAETCPRDISNLTVLQLQPQIYNDI